MGDDPLASVDDVAVFCGVSPATVHAWLHKGTAPKSYKIGKHRRFRWADVQAWIEEQSDEPVAS